MPGSAALLEGSEDVATAQLAIRRQTERRAGRLFPFFRPSPLYRFLLALLARHMLTDEIIITRRKKGAQPGQKVSLFFGRPGESTRRYNCGTAPAIKADSAPQLDYQGKLPGRENFPLNLIRPSTSLYRSGN